MLAKRKMRKYLPLMIGSSYIVHLTARGVNPVLQEPLFTIQNVDNVKLQEQVVALAQVSNNSLYNQ